MAILPSILVLAIALSATCSGVLIPTDDMRYSEVDVSDIGFKDPQCSRPSTPTNGRLRDVGSDRATVLFDWSPKPSECPSRYLQYELIHNASRRLYGISTSWNVSYVRGLVYKTFEPNTLYNLFLFASTRNHTRSRALNLPIQTLNATTNSAHEEASFLSKLMSDYSLEVNRNCTKGRVTPPKNGAVSHLSATSATYSWDWAWDKENDCFSGYQATRLYEKATKKLVSDSFGFTSFFRGLVYINLVQDREYYTETYTYQFGRNRTVTVSPKLVTAFRTANL